MESKNKLNKLYKEDSCKKRAIRIWHTKWSKFLMSEGLTPLCLMNQNPCLRREISSLKNRIFSKDVIKNKRTLKVLFEFTFMLICIMILA